MAPAKGSAKLVSVEHIKLHGDRASYCAHPRQ